MGALLTGALQHAAGACDAAGVATRRDGPPLQFHPDARLIPTLSLSLVLRSLTLSQVGLSLSIPLAMAADAVRNRTRFTPLLMLGTAAVW